MPRIDLFFEHPARRLRAAFWKRKLSRLFRLEGAPDARVNVVLTDNRALRSLNRRFRRKDKPTDVLSFPFHEPDLLGEIYVSLDKAAAQARAAREPFDTELWRLLAHGALHLLGHDHHTRTQTLRMVGAETRHGVKPLTEKPS